MKKLITIIFFLPVIAMSQEELVVKGKMIYGESNSATLQIIESDKPADTTTVQIDKKKFKLEPLDTSKSYELIFTCGGSTKTLTITPIEAKELQTMHLEINWKNL